MKTSLRSYIFFFLMLFLVSMSLSFFISFRFSAQEYINAVARQQVTQKLQAARNELLDSPQPDPKQLTSSGNLLLFDIYGNVIHPRRLTIEATELVTLLTERYFKNRTSVTTSPFPVSTETRDFLVQIGKLEHASIQAPEQTFYAVSYTKMYYDEALLRQVENLILLITLLLALIFTPLLWIGSGRLVMPLRKLQQYTIRLGDGQFNIPQIHSSILEIEELSHTFSTMARSLGANIEAQKTFFQNASHELRTPLMSIAGYAQAVQDNIIPDPALAADVIIKESERMKQLVDGLLILARLDAKEQEVNPVSLDIREYLLLLIERVQGIAMSLKRELIFQTSQKELDVWLDPLLLDKVCYNLLSNALQHAHHYVYIELTDYDRYLTIAVENDGAKLDDAEIPRLFQRFYKGSSGNFGIGLSIVQSAAEYMHGTVKAENGTRGARFVLTLPKNGIVQ